MAKLTGLVVLLIAATALVSASACEREMRPMRHCMQKRMGSPGNCCFKDNTLRQCCSELRQFSSECRCDAVSEMPQMERKLPAMCGMSDCGCASYFA